MSTVVFSTIAPRLSRRITFITCFLCIAPLVLLLSTAPPFPFALAIVGLMGLMAGPINPILMSIRQERVPIAYRARVFGTLTTLAFIAIPLGQLLGGYIVEWIGVQAAIGASSVAYFAVVLTLLVNPVLREMDERPVPVGTEESGLPARHGS